MRVQLIVDLMMLVTGMMMKIHWQLMMWMSDACISEVLVCVTRDDGSH